MLSPEEYITTLRIDEDQLEEVEEEQTKALEFWDKEIKSPSIINFAANGDAQMERLLREIGSQYNQEDHGPLLRAIATKNSTVEGGELTREQFADWFIRWMFTPEEGEGDFDEDEDL